ncbi:3D domain-containing protein, partial [Oceanobacillus oncorhynchi subsp. oncorhynchi]|uniref:3D domain-containing protein n=1 Tax=Oceanobacillus oncorhynchi TaxID=545501 RepID=UPI003635997D
AEAEAEEAAQAEAEAEAAAQAEAEAEEAAQAEAEAEAAAQAEAEAEEAAQAEAEAEAAQAVNSTENEAPVTETNTQEQASGETISVTSTAYTANCEGCSGVTSTGIDLNANPNEKVIAVDPNVIPLGTKVYVEGYGHAVAGDIGGAINGNKIDIHVPTRDEALNWGVREVNVTVVE